MDRIAGSNGYARRRRYFRAAAVEQLQVWGDRNEVPVIAQGTGADSASVIYDAFPLPKRNRLMS